MRRVVVRRRHLVIHVAGRSFTWASVWEVRCPCGAGGVYATHAEAVAVAHQVGLTHAMEAALARDCE